MNSKGKIFYLLGKSASGKDTVYDRLLQDASLCLKPVVIYTTRPIRTVEIDGVTYHFRNIPFYKQCEKDIHLIESRVYETMLGPWYYFTIDDGQIDLEKSSYLMIGTLESYEKMLRYYGSGNMVPLYLEISGAERLQRALDREKMQREPHVDEICRRYLADEKDFSESNLTVLGIKVRFTNENLEKCVEEIKAYCSQFLRGV